MKSKGYAARDAKSPLTPFDFERRELKARDVLIEIEYCGICHSDIHTARNEWGGTTYPCVPGHEIVGKVAQVGNQVKDFKVGARVGVGCLVDSCRTCSSCQDHLENYCETGFTMTYNSPTSDPGSTTYGGYSSHIVVDQDFVLTVPENLNPAGVAPLLCAGITTYSPLRKVGVGKGHKVAVMGLGGLGHMAVKLASSFGAEVTVLSRSPKKADDAKKLGAADFVLTTNEAGMNKCMNHFDFMVDTVSAKHDISQALSWLKRDGTMLLVGASDQPLDLSVFSLIFQRRTLMGSLIGGLKETQEMLDYCGKHGIESDIELIKAEQINDAYERAVKGQVQYRFVIDAKSF